MRVEYKFGLLLTFLLLISKYSTQATPVHQNSTINEEYDYNDSDDDYYYNEGSKETGVGNETNLNVNLKPDQQLPSSIANKGEEEIATISTKKPEQNIAVPPKRSNHVIEPSCPKRCFCEKDFTYVRCTNADLKRVPHGIPATVTHLDLSENQLDILHAEDFINCTKLIELNLSENRLTEISKEVFENNQRLRKINLAGNQLKHINRDAFSSVPELSVLDLSNNTLELPPKGSFLDQPGLLELSCRNCSWTQLYDETFENLNSLTVLKIDQNDFNKKINTQAFTPLRNLIKLRLPTLDQESAAELCNLLKAIDNISFRHFDVSCFELVLGFSFNDSLIQATDPPFRPIQLTTTQKTTTSGEKKITTKMTDQSNASLLNMTLVPSLDSNGSDINQTYLGGLGGRTSSTTDKDDGTYQVPVSQKTINIMLICIMVIALIGLAIGLVCRKDIGGIKTKCCRTSKPEPKEDTQPAEEIPLNKLA